MKNVPARKKKLLQRINPKDEGLEIGPLCWPILTKAESRIQYVDHVSTKELLRLYKDDPGVPSDQIVVIDYPLNKRNLQETVKDKKFSYILASHVIEHVPDMVSWLHDMSSALKPGAVLSLAIPDRRFTFDIDRDVSRPADVVGAYLDGLKKPSSTMVFDYTYNYRTKVDPSQAWEGKLYMTEEAGPHRYTITDALKYSKINRDTDEYVDTHCFVFTPSSFIEVMRALILLHLTDFSVSAFYPTVENEYEFFVTLQKVKHTNIEKLQLASLPEIPLEPTRRELEALIKQQRHELAASVQTIEHIMASKSWQLTKPLRAVLRTARNLSKQPD